MVNDPRASSIRDWGCTDCRGSSYSDQDKLKDSRNCKGDPKRRIYLSYDPDMWRCPNMEFDAEVWLWLSWWQDWELWRLLPFGGSDLMNEPLYVYEAFRIMTSTRIAVENETTKRQSDKIEKEQNRWQRTKQI